MIKKTKEKTKKETFEPNDLSSKYKSLSSYINKRIVIWRKENIEEKMGQYGTYLLITLLDGNKIAVSSPAVIRKLDEAIIGEKFPLTATVIEVKSHKNPDRKYFTLV
jgi:uncharacterized protein YqgV (UPF0045/DUF77 family)